MSRGQPLSDVIKRLRFSGIASRELCTANPQEALLDSSRSKSVDKLFSLQSRRRVYGSPVLPLETVAMPNSIQSKISRLLISSKLTPRHLRKATKQLDRLVAHEAAHERRKPARGAPMVALPPEYDAQTALAHALARAPATLAANIYVMAEARRCLGDGFRPQNVLDFGAGIGVGTMAATRVFHEQPFEKLGLYLREHDPSKEDGKVGAELGESFIKEATLVDHSSAMSNMSREVLGVDGYIGDRVQVSLAAALRDEAVASKSWDIVVASYVLNEIVREAMAEPERTGELEDGEPILRHDRVKLAEKRLRRKVKELWARTKEGGIFVVVEDGTAAGFETVVFAREVVRRLAEGVTEDADDAADSIGTVGAVSGAHVVAPCMHSLACPLDGSITRHRVCRFQQRFNRPEFLRRYRPMHAGFEDEYFSYIVVQKTSGNRQRSTQSGEEGVAEQPWGRLVRAPLMKGKHVVFDACTVDGALERRVVSKKSASPGQYPLARRAKWGDVWPVKPTSKPQPINF